MRRLRSRKCALRKDGGCEFTWEEAITDAHGCLKVNLIHLGSILVTSVLMVRVRRLRDRGSAPRACPTTETSRDLAKAQSSAPPSFSGEKRSGAMSGALV
ncbi:unnamed protein product, partial [Menidia menidia]